MLVALNVYDWNRIEWFWHVGNIVAVITNIIVVVILDKGADVVVVVVDVEIRLIRVIIWRFGHNIWRWN
jgi:hypothetical protein